MPETLSATELARMMADPREFRRRLLIDTDQGPRPLESCLDPWQRADFEALDPGWLRAVGRGTSDATQRAFLTRPRGHSKTSDLAVQASWALFAAGRPIQGVSAAADKDQAKLQRDAINRLTKLNRWLPFVCDNWRVRNRETGSELAILSCDAASSYGILVDFIIADEIVHWGDAGESLWISLISAAAKRSNCMLVVITNAGMGAGTSWQWNASESCRGDARWHYNCLEGPVASWISPDALAEQRRLLPAKAFNRLWLNQWQTDTGDCLDSDDIEACCSNRGPLSGFIQNYYPFVSALDLGLKNDHSALVTIGFDQPKGRFILADCRSWAPSKAGGQVDLEQVRLETLEVAKRFEVDAIVYDPWQCALMASQIRSAGVPTIEHVFNSKNMNLMATTLLQVFRNRQIDLYRDPLLVRDLMRLSIVERTQGFKLTATRDKDGHADRAIALAMVLPFAFQWISELRWRAEQEAALAAMPLRVYA